MLSIWKLFNQLIQNLYANNQMHKFEPPKWQWPWSPQSWSISHSFFNCASPDTDSTLIRKNMKEAHVTETVYMIVQFQKMASFCIRLLTWVYLFKIQMLKNCLSSSYHRSHAHYVLEMQTNRWLQPGTPSLLLLEEQLDLERSWLPMLKTSVPCRIVPYAPYAHHLLPMHPVILWSD